MTSKFKKFINKIRKSITTFLGIFSLIYGVSFLSFLLVEFNIEFLLISIFAIIFGILVTYYSYKKVMVSEE